jgi:hypothetical protein
LKIIIVIIIIIIISSSSSSLSSSSSSSSLSSSSSSSSGLSSSSSSSSSSGGSLSPFIVLSSSLFYRCILFTLLPLSSLSQPANVPPFHTNYVHEMPAVPNLSAGPDYQRRSCGHGDGGGRCWYVYLTSESCLSVPHSSDEKVDVVL